MHTNANTRADSDIKLSKRGEIDLWRNHPKRRNVLRALRRVVYAATLNARVLRELPKGEAPRHRSLDPKSKGPRGGLPLREPRRADTIKKSCGANSRPVYAPTHPRCTTTRGTCLLLAAAAASAAVSFHGAYTRTGRRRTRHRGSCCTQQSRDERKVWSPPTNGFCIGRALHVQVRWRRLEAWRHAASTGERSRGPPGPSCKGISTFGRRNPAPEIPGLQERFLDSPSRSETSNTRTVVAHRDRRLC